MQIQQILLQSTCNLLKLQYKLHCIISNSRRTRCDKLCPMSAAQIEKISVALGTVRHRTSKNHHHDVRKAATNFLSHCRDTRTGSTRGAWRALSHPRKGCTPSHEVSGRKSPAAAHPPVSLRSRHFGHKKRYRIRIVRIVESLAKRNEGGGTRQNAKFQESSR